MDIRTASAILSKPWLIESQAAMNWLDLIELSRSGNGPFKMEEESKRPKSIYQRLFEASSLTTAPITYREASDHPGYEGSTTAILPIIGPLMKDDFCGWFGTASLRNELKRMNASSTVKDIVLWIDSPGGTVDGTQPFADTIKASSKDTTAIVDEMMCSAAYWLGSSAKTIVAASETAVIGSVGTMISFYDRTQNLEDNGIFLREYFADQSHEKNRDFIEAKKGNGRPLIEKMLNPMNDIFLKAVRENRGDKLNQEEALTGKTFLAAQALAVGLIDQVDSMDNVLNTIFNKHKVFI